MAPSLCPRCGAPLGSGACPRCPPAPAAISRSFESDSGRARGQVEARQARRRLPEALKTEVRAALGDPARRVGRYVLLSQLGQGGYGSVHRAFDPEMERVVAIKVLERLEERARERFHREVKATARLKHPGVVPIFDVGEANGQPFLVMDFVEGRSLAELACENPLAPLAAARIGRDVALAVAAAHEQKILHRDLKPQNVLVDATGRAVVLDFGLARIADEGGPPLTQSGLSIGTPAYMSPEQACAETEKIGPASDVYSLGATLYQALTGEPPFAAESAEQLVLSLMRRMPDPPSARRPEVPAALDAIVLRCLAKAPGDRFATAAELARALDDFLVAATPRPAPPAPWTRVAIGALFLSVVVAAGVALVARQRGLEAAASEATRQRAAKAAEEATAARVRDAKAAAAGHLAAARMSIKAASWSEAEKELRAVLVRDASNVEAHTLLAPVLFNLQSEECREQWLWLVEHGPKEDAEEHAFLAIFCSDQLAERKGEHAELRARIVDAVRGELADVYLGLHEADRRQQLGDAAGYRKVVLELAARLRDLPGAGRLEWFAAALRGYVLLVQSGVTPQPESKDLLLVARRLLNDSTTRNPDCAVTVLWLAEVYRELGDWRSAATAALRAQVLMPGLARAYTLEAEALLELASAAEMAEEQVSLAEVAIAACERFTTRTPRPRQFEKSRVAVDIMHAKGHVVRASVLAQIERSLEAAQAWSAARAIIEALDARRDLGPKDRENVSRLKAVVHK